MAVVCPKPRRYGFSLDDHLRPLRHQISIGASQAESELLDIILSKDNNREKSVDLMAIDPAFLCGSPPSRAPNPVVQDEQFHKEDIDRLRPQPISIAPCPSSSPRKAGRGPTKFGHQPAIIRVEGFDSRDRRNCSVSALA